MTPPRQHRRFEALRILAGLSLASVLACSGDQPTAATGLTATSLNNAGVAQRPVTLSSSAAASGFSTTLTFSDEYHPTGERVLGTYADTVVAQVTFTGTVDWFRVYPDGHQDFILTFDASGVCPTLCTRAARRRPAVQR